MAAPLETVVPDEVSPSAKALPASKVPCEILVAPV